MKPYTQEALSAEEYDYQMALDNCAFFRPFFLNTLHRVERSAGLDTAINQEHKAEEERMNGFLQDLFDSMVELKLVQEVQNELQAA